MRPLQAAVPGMTENGAARSSAIGAVFSTDLTESAVEEAFRSCVISRQSF